MFKVAPCPRACTFGNIDLGHLMVIEFGGTNFWSLKCCLPSESQLEVALLLGPNLPEGFSSPDYIEYEASTRALDFGDDYTVNLPVEANHISMNLPTSRMERAGIALVGDSYFLRFGPRSIGEGAMFLCLQDGHLAYMLPESNERAFFNGWRFCLKNFPPSNEQVTVCEWPPRTSD